MILILMTVLKMPCLSVLSQIEKWIGEGSDWLFESVDDPYNNIYIYNSPAGGSYMQLNKE